jgi:hypothetical protein
MQARRRARLAALVALGACRGDDLGTPVDAPRADAAIADAAAVVTLDAAVDARSTALPDLTLEASLITNTLVVQDQFFSPDACEVAEACVGAAGLRRLLRFTTVVGNRGAGDLALGPPQLDPRFEYSSCHGHYHLTGFASYQLVGSAGVVVSGRKQAFCLLDSLPLDGSAPGHGYDCSNQGISAGWADSYPRELPCQWIDVTGVAPGVYTLRLEVNPTGIIDESDRTNDVLELPVVL